MWKNIVETNIMVSAERKSLILLRSGYQVGTHVDSLIAESMLKGVRGFNEQLAYEAVYKDATV